MQLDIVEQIVLCCLIIGFCELVYWSPSAQFYRKQVADTFMEALAIFKEVFDSHVSENMQSLGDRQPKDVDIPLWRNLPNSLHQQDRFLADAHMEPALWLAEVPFSAYQQLTTCGRRMNLHLILLHRSLSAITKLRNEVSSNAELHQEQRLLFDDLVIDYDNVPDGSRSSNKITDLRLSIAECMDEICCNMRGDVVRDKTIEGTEGADPDEINEETRDGMNFLDEIRSDGDDYLPVHPTGSKQFKLLADVGQRIMARVYSLDPSVRSPIRKQMTGLNALINDKDIDTMRIRNTDLMTFHAVSLALREFVEALLEADKICWGGDAGWLTAQFH